MSNDHQKTIPWMPAEFITLTRNGTELSLCYRATKSGISCVVLPSGRLLTIAEFMDWTEQEGWALRWPAVVHVDIGIV